MVWTPAGTIISSHLWTLLTESLLYLARQESARALLPSCCQKQFSLTFPPWLLAQGRGLKGEGLKMTRRNKILLIWVCFTRLVPWRVRSQLVRHWEWCFRREEKFFCKNYCHWHGVIYLPQSSIGALPSQKHPGCKNLTRRCNDLLKVLARRPDLPHSHSPLGPGWYSLEGNAKRRSSVLPHCVGDMHQTVREKIPAVRVQTQSVPLCVKKFVQGWDGCVGSGEAAQLSPFSFFIFVSMPHIL